MDSQEETSPIDSLSFEVESVIGLLDQKILSAVAMVLLSPVKRTVPFGWMRSADLHWNTLNAFEVLG
jgi:hypothetical protein